MKSILRTTGAVAFAAITIGASTATMNAAGHSV